MSIWRLQTNTNGGDISEYCIEKKVVALGWSLTRLTEEQRTSIKTISDYKSFAEQYTDLFPDVNKYKIDNVRRLYEDVKLDDIIWMKSNGQYYFALVSENSCWFFNSSEEATNKDASNQMLNIEWIKASTYADESSVPGTVTTAFIKGAAFQRINDGIESYSQHLYNMLTYSEHFKNIEIENNEEVFYSMLSTSDCEDLLCMWLYQKFNYICIPSTNKKSTQLYECVLIEPCTGKRIYPQVKKGSDPINSDNYSNLNGDVWLLTTKGKIIGKNANVNIANPTELYEFALDEKNKNILPESIFIWVKFLKLK